MVSKANTKNITRSYRAARQLLLNTERVSFTARSLNK